jgi:AMIN domain-containing protein
MPGRRVLAIGLAAGLIAAPARAAQVVLEGIDSSPDRDEIVLRLSAPVVPAIVRVPAAGTLPERIAVDLPDTRVGDGARTGAPGHGPVRRVRTGQYTPRVTRVVVELEHATPYRIDARGSRVRIVLGSATTAATVPAAPAPSPAAPASRPPETASGAPQGHPLFLDYSRELAGETPPNESAAATRPRRAVRRTLHLGAETQLPAPHD